MAEKTVKRTVVHPKLYLRVDGKLQRVPVGTEITVTKAQAKSHGAKVSDPSKASKLDDGKMSDGATESEAVAALKAELATSQEATATAAAELAETQNGLQQMGEQLQAAHTATAEVTATNKELVKANKALAKK